MEVSPSLLEKVTDPLRSVAATKSASVVLPWVSVQVTVVEAAVKAMPVRMTVYAPLAPLVASSFSLMVAGPVTLRVRAASLKFTTTCALCSPDMVLRATLPPPLAAVGPSSMLGVVASSPARVTVTVWSSSPAPNVALIGICKVIVPLVWPAVMRKLPLPLSVGV